MNFGIFSYLLSIIIFAGGAILLELLFLRKYFAGDKKYKKVILIAVLVPLPLEIFSEWIARTYDIWGYPDGKILEIFGGAYIEATLFAIAVTIAVAIPTIHWVKKIDAKREID